ncbi:MAG: hypothetical protein ABR584_12010 [Candidatus Baltobacteraceae bacterium]
MCQGPATISGKVYRSVSIYNYDDAHDAYRFANMNSAGVNTPQRIDLSTKRAPTKIHWTQTGTGVSKRIP